jgi:hypothetical protein
MEEEEFSGLDERRIGLSRQAQTQDQVVEHLVYQAVGQRFHGPSLALVQIRELRLDPLQLGSRYAFNVASKARDNGRHSPRQLPDLEVMELCRDDPLHDTNVVGP